MKKIGIFCGKSSVKTTEVTKKILDAFGDIKADIVSIEDAWQKEFESYDYLIVGTSTWFDGELPDYWDEMIPEINTLNLKDKKVAIFGLGDQVDYPDNFVDGIGILAEAFESAGAILVGPTSTEGYNFNRSRAVIRGQFAGLVLDIENQQEKTDQRIKDWVTTLKNEFQVKEEIPTDDIP